MGAGVTDSAQESGLRGHQDTRVAPIKQGARYSRVVLPRRARLFSTIAVLTVAAVNAAGLWSIAASRRAAADEAGGPFRLGTETRARAFERVLAGPRADLRVLARSPLGTHHVP